MNLEDLYRLLRNAHVESQGIVDTLPTPILVLDRDLRVITGNRAFFETFQVSRNDTVGVRLYELGNGQWDVPDLRLLLEQVIPRTAAVIDFEVTHDFPTIGRRTMLLTARRLFHPDNNSTSLLLSIEDATERRRTDAERDIVLAELRHRMRNILGLVRALASQTGTEGRSAEEYRDAFIGRLGALVQSANLDSARPESGDLSQLLQRILEPFSGVAERVEIEPSPPVMLDQTQVLPLGLIVHELATNAVKYGALSTNRGRVTLRWRREKERQQVVLEWKEEGGPPVARPASGGFGTRLIQLATESDLGGNAELRFAPEGLHAVIAMPVRTANTSAA